MIIQFVLFQGIYLSTKTFIILSQLKKLYDSIYFEITSEKTTKKYEELKPALDKAIFFMNNLSDTHQIECVSTILYIVQNQPNVTEREIIEGFAKWSVAKSNRFSVTDILEGIENLIEADYLEETLWGYSCKGVF